MTGAAGGGRGHTPADAFLAHARTRPGDTALVLRDEETSYGRLLDLVTRERERLAALPAAHALSRAGAVATMTVLPAASETGLGAAYARSLSRRRALAGAAAGLAMAVALLGVAALWAAVAVALAAWLLGRLAVGRIGGVTGDVLGAIQQLGELLVLLAAVAAVTAGGWRSPVSSLLALVSGSS